MKKYEVALLISTSVALLLLGGFLLYHTERVKLNFHETRYDELLSREEAAAKTEAERRIVNILKLSKEYHESSQKLNTVLVSSLDSLGWFLVSIAIIQLSIFTSFYKSRVRRKGVDADNQHL